MFQMRFSTNIEAKMCQTMKATQMLS